MIFRTFRTYINRWEREPNNNDACKNIPNTVAVKEIEAAPQHNLRPNACVIYCTCTTSTIHSYKTFYTQTAERELDNMRMLRHEYVVEFFGHFYLSSRRIGIIMELAHGTLNTLLNRNSSGPKRRLRLYETRRLIRQLLEGIQYLHGVNLVHRYRN